MPIIVELICGGEPACVTPPGGTTSPSTSPSTSTSCNVVTAGVPQVEGCDVLTKAQLFVIEEGSKRVMEITLRDAQGKPINLTTGTSQVYEGCSSASSASSESSATSQPCVPYYSESPEVFKFVKARFRIAVATANSPVPGQQIYESSGNIVDPANGVVQVTIPKPVALLAGIYEVDVAITDEEDNILLIRRYFLAVERSFFGIDPYSLVGPPTIQEIQLSIRDSQPENLWLDDVEFDGIEIMQAITRPVAYWNEVPPPIQRFTTAQFPYREHWLKGIQGYLFEMASTWYRRVALKYQAGGNAINDKGKEPEYSAAARLLMEDFQRWVLNKKLELNIQMVSSNVGSQYGRSSYW